MEDGKNKFKAEQFLRDLGLHFNVEMLSAPKQETNIVPFQSSLSMRMDNPTQALSVHIRNLLASYTKEQITHVLEFEDGLLEIETNGTGGFNELP